MKHPEDRYVRDFRRAVNDPRSYWPLNSFDNFNSAAFTVGSLFDSGEDGGWYDPSDTASMIEGRADSSGGVAASLNNVVGTIMDKSQLGGLSVSAYLAATTELVDDGTMDTSIAASDWEILDVGVPPASASMSGGVMLLPRTNVSNRAAAYQFITGVTPGDFYLVSVTAGVATIRVQLGANSGGSASDGQFDVPAGSTYKYLVTPAAVDLDNTLSITVFTLTNGATGTVDNVSIKHIPGNHWRAASDAARPVLRQDGSSNWYLDFDGTDDGLETSVTLSGLTSTSIVGYAIDPETDTDYVAIAGDGAAEYLLRATDSDATTTITEGSGSPTYRLNGAAWTPADRNAVHDDCTGSACVILAQSVDLTGWSQIGISNHASSIPLNGKFYGAVFVDRSLINGERTGLEEYLAGLSGVTLA